MRHTALGQVLKANSAHLARPKAPQLLTPAGVEDFGGRLRATRLDVQRSYAAPLEGTQEVAHGLCRTADGLGNLGRRLAAGTGGAGSGSGGR